MIPKTLINLGSGPDGSGQALPDYFSGWFKLRVDIDPSVKPDIVASITNLSPFGRESVDAIWSAHCLEHLYDHEVSQALSEFHRVLKDDGFLCVIVPDLQTVAGYVASDRMHEVIYQSPAGPITAHDIIFGHGAAVAEGRTAMAHRCGFTPSALMERFRKSPFEKIVVLRRASLELAVVALKSRVDDDASRQSLIAALKL